MAYGITDDKHYKDIANKIREVTGTKYTYRPDEMASSGIMDVDIIAEKRGEDIGYASGLNDGKIAERNTFWDTYQQNGATTSYAYAFYGTRFDDTNFYPRYDIKPTGDAQYMFASCRVTNLKQRLEECKVVLDMSGVTSGTNHFYYCRSIELPTISTISMSGLGAMFAGSYAETIEKLILKDDGSQTFVNAFLDNYALKNIAIEGTIGQSINFKQSPLSYESLMDEKYGVLHRLKDYSGTSTTKTLTLSTTSKGYLSDADKAIAIQKGWTIA